MLFLQMKSSLTVTQRTEVQNNRQLINYQPITTTKGNHYSLLIAYTFLVTS